MVRTKVFVGNLSFKTQEADLTKEFEAAGKVATANIISRGSRSLGYGFVEMESEEEANKAVQMLNKKLIDDREINVEVAKPREENAAAKEGQAPRARRNPRPRAQGQAGGANNNANGTSEGEGQGGDAAPRRRRPAGRRPRRRTNNGEGGAPAAGGDNNNNNNNNAPREPRQPRQPRQPRAPKPEGERAPKIAAPNTLFVANLPFTVDDDALSKIFAGLNLKSAKVVRKRNNRSKGFGFVEFNNEEDQKKALGAIDKKNVEGRDLIVKVAITAQDVAAAGENATNNKDTAAAATTAANPTTAAAASPAAKREATPASPKPATTQN